MDIAQAALNAFFTVGIGLGTALVAFRILKQRVRVAVEDEIVAYLTKFLQTLHDKPESFAPVVNGLLTDVSKLIPAGTGGKLLEGVSAEGIGAIMPLVPKKWRGLVAIAQMFAGKADTAKEAASGSPFK